MAGSLVTGFGRQLGALVAAAVLWAGLWAAPARAEAVTCNAIVEGVGVTLAYNDEADVWTSRKERKKLEQGQCPARVVMGQLAPHLTEEERTPFCLMYDETLHSYTGMALGERDEYGLCDEPSAVCKAVNATGTELAAFAGIETDDGVDAKTHKSGAKIVNGPVVKLARKLDQVGGKVIGAIGAPAALASVVVVGGAMWVCSD